MEIQSWYGSFGDIHFLFVMDGELAYPQMEWTNVVAGNHFFYTDGQTIQVWVNGQFLEIRDAYEEKLITEDMVAMIANIHNRSNGQPIKVWNGGHY